MSSYGISAHEIKKLPGGRFDLWNQASEQLVNFEILAPSRVGGAIRSGGEAYGVCADGHGSNGTIPTFLKIFRHRVPVRDTRNRFLVELGLANHHWLFRGMPFGFLTTRTINGIEIHGNVSHRIRSRAGDVAPTVGALINNDLWNYTQEQRARFCGQICCAVHALEGIGLVHGDLSLANVLIGWQDGEGEVALLIDYDGFYHAKLPLLPLKLDNRDFRRIGTEGFQAPILIDEVDQDAERACVRSDRMALAALVFQLMVWQPDIVQEIGREHILDRRITRQRNLGALPPSIEERWPAGFDLLSKAFYASSYQSMPSPRVWLTAVGGPAPRPPVLLVSNDRTKPRYRRKVELSSQSGDFGRLHDELVDVKFRRNGEGCIVLEFPWRAPIIRPFSQTSTRSSKGTVKLAAGESASSRFWKFEVLSGS